jgi:MFS family permease
LPLLIAFIAFSGTVYVWVSSALTVAFRLPLETPRIAAIAPCGLGHGFRSPRTCSLCQGVYSDDLKKIFNYSQDDIQSLALASNMGALCLGLRFAASPAPAVRPNSPSSHKSNAGNYMAFTSGLFIDRYGPRKTILVAAVLNTIGYLLLWAAADGKFNSPPLWLVCTFCGIWGHASGWLDTAIMAVNMRNFQFQRGLAAGLIKAFYGISASACILSCLLQHFSSHSYLYPGAQVS